MIVAVDPGTKNMGVCTFDGVHTTIHNVDLTIKMFEGKPRRFDLGSIVDIYDPLVRFIDSNREIWPTVTQFVVETQLTAYFKQFATVLMTLVRAKYPHIKVRSISPVAWRAYWKLQGTSHPDRKEKSERAMGRIMTPADVERATRLFHKSDGGRHVDAVEAAYIAIYAWNVPEKPRAKTRPIPESAWDGTVRDPAHQMMRFKYARHG